MNERLEFSFGEDGIITVEGIRMTTEFVKHLLNNPPKGLFAFRREKDQMIVDRFGNPEEAAEYFDS